MANLDPHLLRAFLSVADVGTVNGAAVALHRTQAAVSMQIRRLEDEVGAPLFERSSKGLALTAEGVLLLPYAREILTLNEEVRQRIGGQTIEGRVKLGVVEDFAATRLVDILKAFRDLNPKVQIDLIIAGNRELAALFDHDKLDLLICDTSEISRKPLVVWPEQLLWVVRADLPVAADEPLPVVMFSETCLWRTRTLEALSARSVRWKVVCEASTLVAMATAVQVGIGIGPMMAATIPPGCRALERSSTLPEPVQVDIGLYLRTGAPEQARHLADFVQRASGRVFAERPRAPLGG